MNERMTAMPLRASVITLDILLGLALVFLRRWLGMTAHWGDLSLPRAHKTYKGSKYKKSKYVHMCVLEYE